MSNYTAGEISDEALLEQMNKRPTVFGLDKVTRITVVSDKGRGFEAYDLYDNGVELHLQDAGKTLKIFPRKEPLD